MSLNAHNGFRASGLQGFRASGLQGFRASGRDSVADSLRGFTIILVVYAHIGFWFASSGIILPRTLIISRWIYSFHMPLMFMIAGYVQGIKSNAGYFASLRKAAADLYLPCMYFSLLQWLIMYFIMANRNTANFGAATLKDLFVLPLGGYKEYWFLVALFFIKAIHSAFDCFPAGKTLHFLFWTAFFITLNIYGGIFPLCVSRLSNGLYFHLGYVMKRENYISQDKYPGIIWGITLFLVGVACFFIPYACGGNNFFTRLGAALCSCFGLFVIFYSAGIKYSVLISYGLYSMVIYCLHNWVTAVFRMLFTVSGMSSNFEPAIMFAVTFAAAMIVPLLVVWLYKNIKCLRWIEYIFYPGKLMLRK